MFIVIALPAEVGISDTRGGEKKYTKKPDLNFIPLFVCFATHHHAAIGASRVLYQDPAM